MEFTLRSILLFLNIVIEFCLSFGSHCLRFILSCLFALWSFFFFLCNLVWTSSLPPEWETKNIPQHQGRPKRRRKDGTQKGWRYYQQPQEDKKRLISIPNRTLGQHYDTMRPHQRMCPGPSYQTFSGGDPAANRTGSCYFLSVNILTLLFSEGKPNKKINLLSCKGKVKKKCSFPNQLRPNHHQNASRKMVKHDSLVALPTWNSKGRGTELQGYQQPPHLEAGDIYLLEVLIHHFLAVSSFASTSSPSVVIVLINYSSPFLFHRTPNPSTHQVYPLSFHPLPPSLPAVWPQPSPEIMPQLQCLPPPQTLLQVHPWSPLQENGLFDQELLITHSSTKFQEIKAGGSPEPVCTAQHANQPASSLYVKPETIPKNRSQTPLVGGGNGRNIFLDMSIPACSSQQMSHDNYNNILGSMLGNLSSQALEFMSRWEDSSSHSVSVLNSNLTTSMKQYAEVDSQPGGFMPLGGSSPCPYGDNMETAHAASVLSHPLPASLCVDQEGQGDLGQSLFGTEGPTSVIPVVLQDPQSSDLKEQLSQGIHCEINHRKHSQARGQRSDTSLASDGLTSKASLRAEQPASIVDRRASQVRQVHEEAPGVSVEQRQEPRSRNIIRWCREKIFPNRKQIVNLEDPKLEKPGGVETGLGTSRVGEEDNSREDTAPKEMLGSKSSETLPPKRQSVPKTPMRKKLFCCFQCLNPGNTKSQEKGSLRKSTKIRSSDKNRAVFTENKDQNHIGEFLQEEKEGHQRVTVTCCPVKFGKYQRTTQVGAQAGLPKGHPFNPRNPACQVTNTCQEQCSTSARKIRNKKREAQKTTALMEQSSCESLPRSSSHREIGPDASPSLRLHHQQGPQSALTMAFKSVQILSDRKPFSRIQGQFSTPK